MKRKLSLMTFLAALVNQAVAVPSYRSGAGEFGSRLSPDPGRLFVEITLKS